MRSEQGAFDKFLRDWRNAFRAPSDLWKGHAAVEELKRANNYDGSMLESMLGFVRCDSAQGWRPREMLRKVFAEVTEYKRQRISLQKEFRDAELLLAQLERAVTLRNIRTNHPLLKRFLSNTAEVVERRRKIVSKFISRLPLRSPLGAWEKLWPQLKRGEITRLAVDLDTRLQLQCAKMFRTFLREDEGVSLRTIARLVVLVYKAAGLASEIKNDGVLRLPDSHHAISVRSVEEKLRRRRDLLQPRY
jgi:hypothetical protein